MDWIRSHKAMLSVTIGGFLFAAAAGGKTYTAMAGAGYSDDIARLTANRVFIKDAALYFAIVLLWSLAVKLVKRVRSKA
jgi:hypothetical protein